ncbi:MAG: BamA/TamA family outer membrane protein [Anaeromyxobacteraceae bacterium]
MRTRARGHAATTTAAVLALVCAGPAAADCPSGITTKLIPLPVYATLPNEGNTWGAMPVFLRVCPDGQRTESIIAPSLSWNSVIHVTGTFRWFYYPSDEKTLTVIGSASTHINFNALVVWQRLPTAAGASTDDLTFRLQRSAFFRFFGLGPDTPASAETSYTGLRAYATARRGVNVARRLNLGATVSVERDGVEAIGVPGLPLSRDVFPAAPGMRGATTLSQGVDLRYDDRAGGDYAERGLRAEVGGDVVEGLSGSPTYLRGRAQASGILPEADGLSGTARLSWTAVSSGDVPFYRQSTLGGAFLLRGFTEDRFIGQQAWTLELEQRIRLFQTHIFGVVADWRADPFVALGQVFTRFGDALSNPQVAGGVGFRAFVHPNVLGRVDVAYGGEGAKVYVELGYPY